MLKIGTNLVAIDDCQMEDGGGPALVVGKEYKVEKVYQYEDNPNLDSFSITSEKGYNHHFLFYEVFGLKGNDELKGHHFFEIVKESSNGN